MPNNKRSQQSSNQTSPTIFCKICLAVVPRRKEYHPKVCEACQKFFRRNARRHRKLACTGPEPGRCVIDPKNRRSCTFCRFKKCLEVGMQSKFLNASEENNFDAKEEPSCDNSLSSSLFETSEASEGLSPVKTIKLEEEASSSTAVSRFLPQNPVIQPPQQLIMPLVHDPVLFDGVPVENMFRISVQSFTKLHDLQFLDLKRPEPEVPLEDIEMLMQLSMKQVHEGLRIGLSYGRHFLENCEETFSENELQMLTAKSMASISVVFNNLDGTCGTSSLFGINDSLLPTVLRFFPDCQAAIDACKQLAIAFEKWNPSFVESALLLSILFFKEAPNERLIRLRQRLQLAFNLHCSAQYHGNSAEIESRKRHFERCLQVTRLSVTRILGLMKATADHVPLFALGSAVIEGDAIPANISPPINNNTENI